MLFNISEVVMNDWQLQCTHCSQIFDAREAIWCKCSYQFPTKICPFCLKCFCDSREAYLFFWEHIPVDEKRKTRIIGNRTAGDWLQETGILSKHEVEDIEEEGRRLKISFFKAAYKLGYFSKEELFSIRRITTLSPDELLKNIDYSRQNKDVWKQYHGIIVDTTTLNNQHYYAVAFPAGSNISAAQGSQEKLKGSILPLHLELSFWNMVTKNMPAEETEELDKGLTSYSIKEWLYKLIEEVIQAGSEDILISAELQFNNKSNIYVLRNTAWVLHSLSPVPYGTLLWGLKNLIPEQGKRFRNDYYIMMKAADGRIFITVHPHDWVSRYQECSSLQGITKLMRLSAGLIMLDAGCYAETIGRTIVSLALRQKHSVAVNDPVLHVENAFLFRDAFFSGKSNFKHIALLRSYKEIAEAIRISQSDLVIGVADDKRWSGAIKKKAHCLQVLNFWRLRKLCSFCKIASDVVDTGAGNIALWEMNPKGCSSCNGRGYGDDILLFYDGARNHDDMLGELIAAGDLDWRDMSQISPEGIAKILQTTSKIL
jgi:hypothetical protein